MTEIGVRGRADSSKETRWRAGLWIWSQARLGCSAVLGGGLKGQVEEGLNIEVGLVAPGVRDEKA